MSQRSIGGSEPHTTIEHSRSPAHPLRTTLILIWGPRLLLALILLMGGYFRTLSLTDWDAGTGQHPDERFFSDVTSTVRLPSGLGELYDSARSPLNPRNYQNFPLFVYGPLPVIMTRVVAVALTPVEALPLEIPSLDGPPRVGADPTSPNESRTDYGPMVANPERELPRLPLLDRIFNPEGRNLTTYGEIQKVGRGLATLFDLGSILLLYLLGSRLFNRRSGLLAALLYALAVMPIQQSHFFVDPIFSSFFCLLSLYWAVRVAQGGGWLSYAALGLSIGAAMANRITLATLGGIAVVAALVAALRLVQERRVTNLIQRLLRHELPLLILAGLLTLLSFRSLAPDAFSGSLPGSPPLSTTASELQGAGFLDMRPDPRFLANLQTVRGLVGGEVDFPPSQQWVGRTAYLFPWTNMLLWGMGPALGLSAWIALAIFTLLGLRRLFWPQAQAPRLSPAWVIAAWISFYFAWQGGQFAITLRYLLPIYGGLILFATWGLLTLSAWAQQRLATLRWIRIPLQTLPILVVLLSFAWAYAFTRIYTQPHPRVMAAQWFADYAPPGSYVMSEIWDDPLPLQVTRASWGATYQGISSAPYAEDDPQKYLASGEGLLDQLDRADYITLTSNRVYDSTSRLRMRYPALMRYYATLFSGELGFRLVAEVTSYPRFLGIPIADQMAEEAFHVYDHPRVLIFEKTATFSRARAEELITGNLLWGEVYKSPVVVADRSSTALRLTDSQWPRYRLSGSWAELFDSSTLRQALAPLFWGGLIQLLGLAAFAMLFRLLPWLPDRGYSLAKMLGLLLVAYMAWLAGSLGSASAIPGRGQLELPGWGPLPLAFTPTTLWICALPLLLIGGLMAWRNWAALRQFGRERRQALISAEMIFFGFLLLGLLLRWLNPDLWHPARGGEKPMDLAYFTAVLKSASFPPYDPWHAGGYINYYYFGFVLMGALTHLSGAIPSVAYNLAIATIMALTALGAWGVVYNLLASRSDALERRDERRAITGGVMAPLLILLPGNLAQAFWYLNGYAQAQGGRPEWAFWDATRIVRGTVNEFPFFSFLFGDLHAHLIVMPLSLALLGLVVTYSRDGIHQPGRSAWYYAGRMLLYVPLLGLLVGAIRATNTWDYPSFVGLTVLIMGGVAWRAGRGRRPLLWQLAWIVGPPFLMLMLGNLFFAPFTAAFATASSGVELWREGLAPSLLAQLLFAERTTLRELLLLHGHWLAGGLVLGLLLLWRLYGRSVATTSIVVLTLLTMLTLAMNWPALLVSLPLLGGAIWLLWRQRRAPYALLLPGLWLSAGLGLLVLVELIAVKGDIGRMNTVFKFGLHAWSLMALGLAALLPRLWLDEGRLQVPRPVLRLLQGGLALLALATLVYPLTATPARVGDRWAPDAPRSLDGAEFMRWISAERNGAQFSLDEDAAAIAWLQRNVVGTPVIVEAHLPSYQWAGRVATFTGLPTILGWEWHQIQQRGVVGAEPAIRYRQQAVETIYRSPDATSTLQLLQQYGVEYLYLGGVERQIYPPEGLAKFETMRAAGELEQVFQQGQTAIYRLVNPGQPRMLTSDLALVVPTLAMPPPLLLDRPVNSLPTVDEYGWNSLVAQSSLGATLLWLLAFYLLGLLGLPLAYTIFSSWYDAGAAWARLIGLLLLGYAVWLPASIGLWRYDRWGLLGGLVLLIGLNLLLLRQLGGVREGLRRIAAGLRERRRGLLWSEAIFLVGFGAMALIRAANPDVWHPVWGGEKPMEFGFLNAILRSPVMPPYDPFFSGGHVNYYYYGFFLFSLPIKLTGIAPAIGFNLAIATIAGLMLVGSFALVHRLTGRGRYGLLGAGFLVLAGNLSALVPAGWSRGIGAAVTALREGELTTFGARLGDWFIGSSRVIPNTINEFPAFSLLFADLHPHLIALPIVLLVVALSFNLARPWRGRPTLSELGLLALSLGAVAITNSWDFPTYGLLVGLALLGSAWRADGARARGWPILRMLTAGGLAVGVGLVSLLLYTPFFDRYWAPVGGIGQVGWNDGTRVLDYLLLYGIFMALLLPLLGGALWRLTGRWRLPLLGGSLILLGVAAALPNLGLRPALLILLLIGLTLLPRRILSHETWYTLLLAWLAWAVSLGMELIFIRDHLSGGDWYRMNTVFKFGLQVWVVLALAAAASVPIFLRGLSRLGGLPARRLGVALVVLLLLASLTYPLVAIPSRLATRFTVDTGLTLDGLAFLKQASFGYDCATFGGCEPEVGQVTIDLRGDAEAIAWLNRSIRGTPIIVQSNLSFYRAYGIRIAANTGLPTVISALHVNEQRDPAAAARRDRDLDQFYRSSDIEQALTFLARYGVDYIYVGGAERAFYPAAGLAKFEQMNGTYLESIYRTPEVQIYAVTGVSSDYARPRPFDFITPVTSAPTARPVDTGLGELEEAQRNNPTDGPTAFGLAEAYRAQGRLDEAITVLEPAGRANPGDVGVLHLWGDILAQAGRSSEAEEVYTTAARNNPTPGNWSKLGAALIEWGELDKAAIALGQAIALDSEAPDPYYHLGRLFALKGEPTQATDALETYLRLDPAGRWANEAATLLAELKNGN